MACLGCLSNWLGGFVNVSFYEGDRVTYKQRQRSDFSTVRLPQLSCPVSDIVFLFGFHAKELQRQGAPCVND